MPCIHISFTYIYIFIWNICVKKRLKRKKKKNLKNLNPIFFQSLEKFGSIAQLPFYLF